MPIRSIFPDGRTLIGETLERGQLLDRAELILRLLAHRGLPVSDAVRARVEGCADLDVLGVWFDRAIDVPEAELIFGDPDA